LPISGATIAEIVVETVAETAAEIEEVAGIMIAMKILLMQSKMLQGRFVEIEAVLRFPLDIPLDIPLDMMAAEGRASC